MHDVTHRCRRAAVTGDRLAHHREGDVVLAEAAVFLRHCQRQESVLTEELQVPPRESQLVIRPLGVVPHLLLAQLNELATQLLVVVGQRPVRIPVIAESPVRLRTPHLFLAHRGPLYSRLFGNFIIRPVRGAILDRVRSLSSASSYDKPMISPSASMSIRAAAGFADSPG